MKNTSLNTLPGVRIDIIAPPFSGHLYPLIPLARRLKQEGANVRFITGPQKMDLLKAMGFHVVALLKDHPTAMEDIANTNESVGSNIIKLIRQLKQNSKLMLKVMHELREHIKADTPALIIADSIAAVAGLVSTEFQLPWINTIATPFALENKQGTPAYFGGLSPATHFMHTVRDWFARKIIKVSKRFIFMLCKKDLCKLGVSLYRKDGSEAIYSPYSILGFGLHELEFKRDWPPCFKMIGPVLETPETHFSEKIILPDHKTLILVTLGTHLRWAKNHLLDNLKPLMEKCPELYFCISLGLSEQFNVAPLHQEKNFSVYAYIPYSAEIQHFSAVIHHGGAGITYSCIAAKKPSLVIPHDYDQFDFAQRIKYHQLGLTINDFKDEKAAASLRALLQPQWQTPLNFMATALKNYSPEEVLLSEVHSLLKQPPP